LENSSEAPSFVSYVLKKQKVIGAATTVILQNFPETLQYNESLAAAGIEQYLDIFGLNIYGSGVERFYFVIEDFLESLTKPIWVTESGHLYL